MPWWAWLILGVLTGGAVALLTLWLWAVTRDWRT
jgi:hypothetical protein